MLCDVNDIRLRRMIYRAVARHDISQKRCDIISVPSYAAGVYHPPRRISYPQGISSVTAGNGYHCKRRLLSQAPFAWPARRDSNPRPPESESDALSSCATGGYFACGKVFNAFCARFQRVFNTRASPESFTIISQSVCVVNSFLCLRYTIFQHHKALTISIFS